jgi:hypothetical protein
MQFPNYENPDGGPRSISTRGELEGASARRRIHVDWKIYTPPSVALVAATSFTGCTRFPCNVITAPSKRQHAAKTSATAAQDYDETWAFHHGQRSGGDFKLPIHLYWAAIMILMRLGGDVFRRVRVR